MSEIKVNSIKGVGASTAAITVNNTDGTCTANITNNLSNRNLIINGAMQVAQRGTSYTGGGYATVDRFFVDYAGLDEVPTQAQVDVASSTTPYTLGFRKAWKITNGNQTSGAGAADAFYIDQKIEAQNIAQSGWNYTSSSSNITLSFWIKSSVAQSFKGSLKTIDGTAQIYHFDTGSLTADTWTKITKTIPGNSNLQFDTNNEAGLDLIIHAFAGTNFTDSSANENAWQAYSGGIFGGKDNTSTWYTTNDATLEITGFQLEVGSVATDFEHRSFAQELALCQRYYYVHASGYQKPIGAGVLYNSAQVYAFFNLPTEMRSTPTLEQVTGTDYFIAYNNGSADPFNDFDTIWHASANMMTVVNFNDISLTGGGAAMVETNNASAKLAFTAEL